MLLKKIGDNFYEFVQFCDGSLNARKLAFQLAKSDDTEYWAFDTKKWKALIPPIKNSWKFNSKLPIYRTDDTGKAELLINYVNRIVNNKTGRRNESYKRLHEQDVEIEVKHEGILEVPEGKNVDDLPMSHFEKLAKKKGIGKITKALNNLQVWNKNDDPKLSKWAGDMIDKLNKKLKKDESLFVKENRYGYVHDEEEAKLPIPMRSYMKRTGWVPINMDGKSYFEMDFNYGNQFCTIYVDEWGNCYLTTDGDDIRPSDMFYTITEIDNSVIDDLITLGNTITSTGDVSSALDVFFG